MTGSNIGEGTRTLWLKGLMPPHTPSRMPPRTCTHCAIIALTSDAATPPTHHHHVHRECRHTPPTPCQRRRHLHHRERDRIAERRRRTPPSILYFGRGGALHSCEDGRRNGRGSGCSEADYFTMLAHIVVMSTVYYLTG